MMTLEYRKNREILNAAVKTWGQHAQNDILIEEMNELGVELSHWNRNRLLNYECLADETIDVRLTLDGLILYFKEYHPEINLEKMYMDKMDRLVDRLPPIDRLAEWQRPKVKTWNCSSRKRT